MKINSARERERERERGPLPCFKSRNLVQCAVFPCPGSKIKVHKKTFVSLTIYSQHCFWFFTPRKATPLFNFPKKSFIGPQNWSKFQVYSTFGSKVISKRDGVSVKTLLSGKNYWGYTLSRYYEKSFKIRTKLKYYL